MTEQTYKLDDLYNQYGEQMLIAMEDYTDKILAGELYCPEQYEALMHCCATGAEAKQMVAWAQAYSSEQLRIANQSNAEHELRNVDFDWMGSNYAYVRENRLNDLIDWLNDKTTGRWGLVVTRKDGVHNRVTSAKIVRNNLTVIIEKSFKDLATHIFKIQN